VRVGVVGPTGHDTVTPVGGEAQSRPGGALLYAGRALREAGAEPVLVGKGEPLEGALVLPGRPFQSVLRFTAEGLEQTLAEVGEPFGVEETCATVLPELRGCRWVVLGAQSAGDFPPETLALLAAGHRLLLDAQGLVRGPDPGPVRLHPLDATSVRDVDALKLNEPEALAAFGSLAPEHLRSIGPGEVLVTRAEHGALVVARDEWGSIEGSGQAFPDPTGAGDSWAALYALARTQDASPLEAGRYAVDQVERLYRARAAQAAVDVDR
jgi:hypothetical protein